MRMVSDEKCGFQQKPESLIQACNPEYDSFNIPNVYWMVYDLILIFVFP